MPFLIVKPDYPHAAITNARLNVRKGEIIECPPDYEPSSSFLVFGSRAEAEKYLRSLQAASQNLPEATQPATPPPAAEGRSRAPRERGSPSSPPPLYPLFRRVSSIQGETVYQLFSRDIHRFLSQPEPDIMPDLQRLNIHKNTAQRLLDYEERHFHRPSIIQALKAIIEREEKGESEGGEEKEGNPAGEGRTEESGEKTEKSEKQPKAPRGITHTGSPGVRKLLQP